MEKITQEEFDARLAAVRQVLEQEGVDALVIGASAQLDQRGVLRWLMDYYLPVFEEVLVVRGQGNPIYFAHNGGSAHHAAGSPLHPEVRVIPPNLYLSDPAAPVASYLCDVGAVRVGIAGLAGLSARFAASLQAHLPHRLRDLSRPMDLLRMVKSPAEVSLTRQAIRLNEDTLANYARQVQAGRYELDVLAKGYAFAALAGAEDQFWLSGSGGGAVPAPLAVAKVRRHRWDSQDYHTLVIEHSATGGHFGEVCQTLRIGHRDPCLEAAQAAVVEAIQAAAGCIRPGNTVGQVAAAAEQVLRTDGWMAPRCPGAAAPPMGHGQGLDFWELPSVSADNTQLIVPGMRFNLHPAVMTAGGNKVTFCDCYLSTPTGAERLSTLSYEVIYC